MTSRVQLEKTLAELDADTRKQADAFLSTWDATHGDPVTQGDWDTRLEALNAFLQWGEG